jgi:mono/diheme cytochrome c family protein
MRLGRFRGVKSLRLKTFFGVGAIVALAAIATVTSAQAAAAPDGKAIFLAQKCSLCHSVSAAGIERQTKSEKVAGPDLTTATAKHDKAFLIKFIKKEEMIDGKKHGKEWKGTDAELGAVIDWLKEPKK